jgi:hypothetical protein
MVLSAILKASLLHGSALDPRSLFKRGNDPGKGSEKEPSDGKPHQTNTF